MLPSTRRGVLLFVSDRTEPTPFSGHAADAEAVVTRRPESLRSSDALPPTDWVLVDAATLGAQRPSWLDGVTGDVYVLTRDGEQAPAWVRQDGIPVLDAAFVDSLGGGDTSGLVHGATDDADSTVRNRDDGDASTPNATADAEPTSENPFDSLSAIPYPIALLDGEGVIRFVNSAWERFGVTNGRDSTETDVGTNYLANCQRAESPTAEAAYGAIRSVIDGKSDGEEVEYPCHGRSEERWYSMTVVPTDDSGPIRAAVVHTDISQYRQHINVLDRVLRHNLRNKANIILGHAAALASDRDDETATAATTIGAAARELLSLSDQARRYREVTSDERPTTVVDAVSVVSEVTARLSETHPHAVVETSLPSTAVVRASQSLSLVVHELVENALVHNDSETPWVRVEVTRVHERGDERVSIRVLDDGPGIPAEDQRLLTGGMDQSPLRHGSQLGVWVVNSLVTSLDGTVMAESRAPRGSIITMTFPSVQLEA